MFFPHCTCRRDLRARAESRAQPIAHWRARACTCRRDLRARAGFTLIELMVVLAIVGILVMSVAPSLSAVLADNRHAASAMDLVRLSRRARSRAISTHTAQLLLWRGAGSNQLGVIDLFSGMNPRCSQTPWGTAFAAAATDPLAPVEIFDMAVYNPTNGVTAPAAADTGRYVIRLTFEGEDGDDNEDGVAGTQICYQPNGETYRATGTVATTFTRQIAPVRFFITRTLDGTQYGTQRHVLFPAGGTARLP